ncbi:MAG TPA: hypothetical protein VMD09_10140 [Solirubrobacteraceae bacterium]|nr:hypothetical protein [Solirubrobacteraceae bacterium]
MSEIPDDELSAWEEEMLDCEGPDWLDESVSIEELLHQYRDWWEEYDAKAGAEEAKLLMAELRPGEAGDTEAATSLRRMNELLAASHRDGDELMRRAGDLLTAADAQARFISGLERLDDALDPA